MNRILPTITTLLVLLSAGTAEAQSRRGASRVDFDDQLIQGQVNRGAVHLIERKDSELGSLVKTRQSFRKEILAGTAVEDRLSAAASPAAAALAVPAGLPVVKAADLNAASAPEAKVAPAPAKRAPSKAAAPARKAPATKKTPAKQTTSKQQKLSKSGGSRAISRR